MIVRKHFLKEFTLQCINFAALQKSKFYNEKFTLKPLFILTQNVKFGYSQVTQRRYSRREFPREFGRTNTQKSEWVHFFYRKFPYFSQREFPKVSAVMGTQKHWWRIIREVSKLFRSKFCEWKIWDLLWYIELLLYYENEDFLFSEHSNIFVKFTINVI